MEQDQLFERLWNGTAPMEEWTQAVSDGAVTSVSENIISVHTTYLCGSVTVIRTAAGLVFARHGQTGHGSQDPCRRSGAGTIAPSTP